MPTKHTAQITRENLAKHAAISLHVEHDTDIAPSYPDDPDLESEIRNEIANGSVWAWCVVTVTATLDDLTGRDSMGGCSYASEADFRKNEYSSMMEEALDDLWRQMEARTPAGRAKALAAGYRQAITTSFRGPSDKRGSRIVAKCEALRISVGCDDALDIPSNHAAAALQLMARLGWDERNDLVMGGTSAGYVFVQVDKVDKRSK